jgi:hypothetical protein
MAAGADPEREPHVKRTLVLLAAVAAASPSGAADKPKKPSLDLRATPRMAFSPVVVSFTAEMNGGEDVEEYYCPEIEWDWDDGGKSTQEGDCEPYEPGKTPIQRRFTNEHEYRRAGTYNVKVSFFRARRKFLSQTVRVTVRAGLGDRTIEDE